MAACLALKCRQLGCFLFLISKASPVVAVRLWKKLSCYADNYASSLTSLFMISRLSLLYAGNRDHFPFDKEKASSCISERLLTLNPRNDLLSHGISHTTIGAVTFHFWVRDGIRWYHDAIVPRKTGFDDAYYNAFIENCYEWYIRYSHSWKKKPLAELARGFSY